MTGERFLTISSIWTAIRSRSASRPVASQRPSVSTATKALK
jgi:hypothetical protein